MSYTVHDVHRLLLLFPIVLAAYSYGPTATVIVILVSGWIWMLRALFFSPYPAPLTRMVLSLVAEGALGLLIATAMGQKRRIQRLEKAMERTGAVASPTAPTLKWWPPPSAMQTAPSAS